MRNFSKNLKNIFAKFNILPFIFCCVFLLLSTYSLTILKYNDTENISQVNLNYSKEYLEYLQLSEDEKQTVLIPRKYDVSFESIYESPAYLSLDDEELPTEYSLYNLNLFVNNFSSDNSKYENLKYNVGNQSAIGICWSFSTMTSLETTIYKQGLTTNDETLNFSEMHMAYNSQVVNRNEAYPNHVSGGNFELAIEYLSSEQGPILEQTNENYAAGNYNNMYWNNSNLVTEYYRDNYLATAEHSGYSVLETYAFPSISTIKNSTTLTEEQKTEQISILRNSIKNHIKTYGAVTTSVYYDSNYLVERSSSRDGYVYFSQNNSSTNHMITLVGWDDDYTYTELVDNQHITHTGAYIAQNSHGTTCGTGGFFYILYDDQFVETNINGFVRVGKTLNDNIKYNNMSGLPKENEIMDYVEENNKSYFTMSSYFVNSPLILSNIYQVSDIQNQYISRIKLSTSYISRSTNFYVYILDNLSENDVGIVSNIQTNLKNKFSNAKKIKNINAKTDDEYLFTSNQFGYFTIDIAKSDYNTIEGEFFAIYILYNTGGEIIKINNVAGAESFQPYNNSYISNFSNGVPSQFSQHEFLLPMIVETQYQLSELNYTVEDYLGVYDGNEKNIKISVTNTNNAKIYYRLNENEDWSNVHPSIKNAGLYNIFYKIEADCYITVIGTATINISKQNLIVTPKEGQSTIYGDSIPTIGYNIEGKIQGETPSFTSGSKIKVDADVLNVGEYNYSSNLQLKDNGKFLADNYNLIFNTLNNNLEVIYFEVKPRTLYISPTLTSKVYGESDPVIYYNYTNQKNGEEPSFEGALSRVDGNNVGLYNVLSNNLDLNDNLNSGFLKINYSIELIDFENKFEITQRSLIISPYGEYYKSYTQVDDPIFLYTYSGNAIGEEPLFENSLSRAPGSDVGYYPITLGNLSIVDNGGFLAKNYKLVLSNNTVYLVINDGEITDCVLEAKTLTYDGQNHTLLPYCQTEGVSFEYSTDGNNWQKNKIYYTDVGSYTIYAKFIKENFATIILSNTLTIKAKILTVTPIQNQTFVYGEQLDIKYTTSGYIYEKAPVFSGSLVVNNINVGDREIQTSEDFILLDCENHKASNYMLSITKNVTIKITPRTIFIIPIENQYKVYDGTNTNPDLSFDFTNVAYGENVNYSGSLQRVDGINVGEYEYSIQNISLVNSIDETFKAGNYYLELLAEDNKFKIIPANITVTAEDKSSFYTDEVVTDFTYTVEGDYVLEDNLNVTYSCEVNNQTKKGEYEIKIFANNSNYNITLKNGTYTVAYKVYNVRFKVLDEIVLEIEVEHFSKIKEENLPQINLVGYTFMHWLEDLAVVNWENKVIEKDTVFVASVILTEFTITYNLNGGNLDESARRVFYINTETFELPTPTKEGFSFVGWYAYSNFKGDEITHIEKGTSSNIKLFAKWEVDTLEVTLPNITGCEILCNSTILDYYSTFAFNIKLSEEYNQSYENIKVFIKWNNSNQKEELFKNEFDLYQVENVKNNFEIIVENVVINKYKINFLADDVVIYSIEKEHGDSLLEEELPEVPMENKEHYNQQQPYWETKTLNNVTNDYNIKAVYIPNIYNVTFKMEDGKEYIVVVNYGEKVDYSILADNYIISMFEYFSFDSSLNNITENTIINVTIKSNIHYLYIVLGCLGGLITLGVIIRIIKKVRRRKFNWWNYATPPKK